MDRKNRGTYKVNRNLTPLQNVVELLKLTFPMEVTLTKMSGGVDRDRNSLEMNHINIYPADNYKNPTEDSQKFAKVVFGTRVTFKHRYSKNVSCAIYGDDRISLSYVTQIVGKLTAMRKEVDDAEAERKAEIKAREDIVRDIRERAHLSEAMGLCQTYRKTWRLDIPDLTVEQLIKVGTAIYNELGFVEPAPETEETE